MDHRPDLVRLRSPSTVRRVRGAAGTRRTATDLVSLLRYTVGLDAELVPYADRVQERYAGWLAQQSQAGVDFTDGQRWWLDRMVSVIASSAGITPDDLDSAVFAERGGVDGALRDLGRRRRRDCRVVGCGADRVTSAGGVADGSALRDVATSELGKMLDRRQGSGGTTRSAPP